MIRVKHNIRLYNCAFSRHKGVEALLKTANDTHNKTQHSVRFSTKCILINMQTHHSYTQKSDLALLSHLGSNYVRVTFMISVYASKAVCYKS